MSRHVLRYEEPGMALDVPVELGAQPYGVYLSQVRLWTVPPGTTLTPRDRARVDERIRRALSFLGLAFDIE